MPERLRLLPAGSDGLLVELGSLAAALSLFDALLADRPAGVTDLVPAARTVLVRFDPLATGRSELADRLAALDLSARRAREGRTIEIPVRYDGEDLAEVAEILGWPVQELVRRHTAATFTVAFTGFAPGFAYMTSDEPAFDVPRRKTPRVRIPAGSVAIGGTFGGVYPSDSPGGWQLLGTTPLAMWDASRTPAALLAPGDRVRFRDMGDAGFPAPAPPEKTVQAAGLLVTRADRPALYQDLGRPGHASQGLAASGAMDRAALREANLCVGNPRGAAAIEIAFGGFALRADRAVTLAVTGAPCPLAIRADGRRVAAPHGRPFALDAGDELCVGPPREGMRSYLALRGGFAVEPVLGSASSDTLARVGPAPILAGDVVVPAENPAAAVDPDRPAAPALPRAGDTVPLDVVLGPRTDWLTAAGLDRLTATLWEVTPQSSRAGVRLAGPVPLERRDTAELPSEGTVRGSIQVPHGGQPVLFLADHPLTGGYPVVAVVAAHHLDLAGQVPIGARVRFDPVAAFAPETRNAGR